MDVSFNCGGQALECMGAHGHPAAGRSGRPTVLESTPFERICLCPAPVWVYAVTARRQCRAPCDPKQEILMNRILILLLIAALSAGLAVSGGADETRDHVCFRALDTDKDGRVTFEEFARHYGADEARFKAADTDRDGRLTHDEYHALLGHGA
jgi:hypothetical protein